MLAIPEHVLKDAPWSISKAGVIEKCSLQFDYKYHQKLKELVTFEESRVGVAVHKALEMILDGHDQKKSFLMAGDTEALTTDELEQLQSFWDQVGRFKKKMDVFKQKHGVREVLIERRWAITPDFKTCTFFDKKGLFRGVLDFGMPTARGDMVIIDHKSGKQKELKYYDAQFRGYCIMALVQRPDIKGVQTAINFIQTDALEWNPYVPAEQIREEYFPWLIKYLTDACAGLLADPCAKKGWWCGWCGYKPMCPAHGGSGVAPEVAQ